MNLIFIVSRKFWCSVITECAVCRSLFGCASRGSLMLGVLLVVSMSGFVRSILVWFVIRGALSVLGCVRSFSDWGSRRD